MTRTQAIERVSRGAAHLDRVRPGWEHRINTRTLTLSDPCGCVIGQLCHVTFGYWNDAAKSLGVESVSDQRAMGFERDHNDMPIKYSEWEVESERRYQLLQDAWLEAIAERRSAPRVTIEKREGPDA